MASSEERMARLVESLLQAPGLAESLPSEEGEIVRDALAGQSVYEIAQQHRVTERRVWDIVGNAARGRGFLRAGEHAYRIAKAYPNCGLTGRELVDWIADAASKAGVAVELSQPSLAA